MEKRGKGELYEANLKALHDLFNPIGLAILSSKNTLFLKVRPLYEYFIDPSRIRNRNRLLL
ncbi:hypothetical protein AS29_014905 [Bacillus sp. SJS]|nr:hypothetical protein AS29_014905 [Bacillus sp. SJS]